VVLIRTDADSKFGLIHWFQVIVLLSHEKSMSSKGACSVSSRGSSVGWGWFVVILLLASGMELDG